MLWTSLFHFCSIQVTPATCEWWWTGLESISLAAVLMYVNVCIPPCDFPHQESSSGTPNTRNWPLSLNDLLEHQQEGEREADSYLWSDLDFWYFPRTQRFLSCGKHALERCDWLAVVYNGLFSDIHPRGAVGMWMSNKCCFNEECNE